MPIIRATNLRPAHNGLPSISNEHPGWYRWWAPVNALEQLLGTHFKALSTRLTQGSGQLENLYCIYVGVAIKKSIRARLDWHVNQKHTVSCVRSGTLSTLRQSIASLVGSDQLDETATNDLIDQLTIEYFTSDEPIRSEEARMQLEQLEAQAMKDNVLPLNIQGNQNEGVTEFKPVLKEARRTAKQHALN